MATAAMVLGILSVVFDVILGWAGLGYIVGLVLGIIALVLSVKGKPEAQPEEIGKYKAGFILGIIGVSFAGIGLISCIGIGCAASSAGAAGLMSL